MMQSVFWHVVFNQIYDPVILNSFKYTSFKTYYYFTKNYRYLIKKNSDKRKRNYKVNLYYYNRIIVIII